MITFLIKNENILEKAHIVAQLFIVILLLTKIINIQKYSVMLSIATNCVITCSVF